MNWIETFDGIFWISLATLLTGSVGMGIKFCLKSKCEHFSCCFGVVTIDRRVDLEVEEEIKAMELGIKNDEEEKKV